MATTTDTRVTTYENFIGGRWVPATSGEVFENRNPADSRDLIGFFQKSTARDAQAALDAARKALAMRFFSDNAAAVHPAVLAAMAEADVLDTAYDGDRWSGMLDARLSALFETEVEVLWVPTGTAANCLALAALCPPHGAVLCHHDAHIQNDEGGAPEFYTHGAKLLLAGGDGASPSFSSRASRKRSMSLRGQEAFFTCGMEGRFTC